MTYTAPNGGAYPLFDRLIKADTMLVAGVRGSGKSVLENGMLYSIFNKYTPNEAQIYLIDPKKVDLVFWRSLPHVRDYADNIEDALLVLDELNEIMENRYKYVQPLAEEGYDIDECGLSEIYLFIDEITDLIGQYGKRFIPKLMPLMLKSRAAKIHIICCSQTAARMSIPALMLTNMRTRVGLKLDSEIASRQIIGCKGCESLADYGEAIIKKDGKEGERVDVPMYTKDYFRAMKRYYSSQRMNIYSAEGGL